MRALLMAFDVQPDLYPGQAPYNPFELLKNGGWMVAFLVVLAVCTLIVKVGNAKTRS